MLNLDKESFVIHDRLLLSCAILLTLWGVLCVYSAVTGPLGRGLDFAMRQILFLIIGLLAMFIIMLIGYRKLLDAAYPIYALTLLILLITPVLAPNVKGAHSWISLGGFRLQPSEFAKVALIIIMSKVLSRYPPLNLKAFVINLAVAAPAVFLVLMQPDAGSALVYLIITFGMLFAAGAPVKYFLAIGGAGLSAMPLLWLGLKEYQKNRLLVFLDPMTDPLGAGYNVIQSRIAVGSGAFWGKGFLKGMQSKLRFLPEPHTDFIFSVSAEEFGFVGSMILLILFALAFTRLILVGPKNRDVRCKPLVSGVAVWMWFQMFESIGMSIGLMPVTGLPLPFLSYGGSSLLALFLAVGLVESVCAEHARRPYYY